MIVEKIYDEKVKLGKAQFMPVFFICLLELNGGAQHVLCSFFNPIFKEQFELSQNQTTFLASVFYIGILFASIVSGKLADKYGRKPILVIGCIMQIIVSYLMTIGNSYNTIVIIRALYGFSHGFSLAILTCYIVQIMPLQYRGKGVVTSSFFSSLGKIYGVVLAYFFLNSFIEGNWKAMIIFSCIPNVLFLVWALFNLYESPRFLIASNNIDKACKVIEWMMVQNNKDNKLKLITEDEKNEIINFYNQTFKGKQKAKIKDIFSQRYLQVTLCLGLIAFCVNCSYFGQLLIMPFLQGEHEHQSSFVSYFITIFGELPCILISLFFIDKANFGRKNTLIYFFIISATFLVLFGNFSFVAFSFFSRLSMKTCFQMLHAISAELYGTTIRTVGFGVTSAIGRFGAAIIPFIIIPMTHSFMNSIFYTLAFLMIVAAIASYFIPYDTMNHSLDENLAEVQKTQHLKQQLSHKQISIPMQRFVKSNEHQNLQKAENNKVKSNFS